MSTQRQEEIPKWSKLGNSENSWYNIFRKRKGVISQGYSGKAQGATGLTDGSNLVYWATYTYTYKQKNKRNVYVLCAGAENPKAATDFIQNTQRVPPFQKQTRRQHK